MESGLEDRNNGTKNGRIEHQYYCVSMESGLEDRNNLDKVDANIKYLP